MVIQIDRKKEEAEKEEIDPENDGIEDSEETLDMENEDKIDEKKFNLLEKFKKKSGEVSKEDDEKVLEETKKRS